MHALILRLSGSWIGAYKALLTRCSDAHSAIFVRLLILLGPYTLVLCLSRWFAYQLRFEFEIPVEVREQLFFNSPWIILLKLVFLHLFGQYSGLLSYFSIPDLRRLIQALMASSVMVYLSRYYFGAEHLAPTGVIAIDFVLSLTGLTLTRLAFRIFREQYVAPRGQAVGRSRRVGIIGAGDAGAALARELFMKKGAGLKPVAFFDDDRSKWRSRVHGIPVIGAPECLLENKDSLGLEEVIIAMPSAPPRRIKEVVKLLSEAALKFETVPSLEQLATGQVKVSHLRKVEIEDLLGREPVELETDDIREVLLDRVVMVTGAGGSIGSELCRQIGGFKPRKLLLVERSESHLFQIEQQLIDAGLKGITEPIVADIMDYERMASVFARFRPDVVFHAAAHKHVPMMESQPDEAFMNNTVGTVQLAELALKYEVERFVMISTDKAINPTNVMGTTKRLAEMYLQALSAENPGRTKFMAVRFGNVLGSSGSVVPTFTKQIAAGGPVKVTHRDVTRYFMTIPEAVGLVLQSASLGAHGEILVLDMGTPVKIVDLARQLIELNGLKPDEDIEIEFVGLRPGEKLYEELSYKGENIKPTRHPKIHRLQCQPEALGKVRGHISALRGRSYKAEPNEMKQLLGQAVPEYLPFLQRAEVTHAMQLS